MLVYVSMSECINIGPLVADPSVYVRNKRGKKNLEISAGVQEDLKPQQPIKVCSFQIYLFKCSYLFTICSIFVV